MFQSRAKRYRGDARGEPRIKNEWEASYASRFTFNHMGSLLWYGFFHQIQQEDLGEMMYCDTSEKIHKRITRGEELVVTGGWALIRKLVGAHKGVILASGFCKLIGDALTLLNPVLLSLILQWFEQGGTARWNFVPLGYLYAVLLLFSSLFSSLFIQWHHHLVIRLGIQVRTFLRVEIFSKALKVESSSLEGKGKIQAVSCQSVDAENMNRLFLFMHYIWAAPVILTIAAILLYNELQLAGLTGYTFMVLFVPLQAYLGKVYRRLTSSTLKYTDGRVRLVKEVVNGIKLVKIDTMEEHFMSNIRQKRQLELGRKQVVAYYDALNKSLTAAAPILVAAITFMTYAAISNEPLTAEKAFTSLALLNIIRLPLFILPMVVRTIGSGIASATRVSTFLQFSEHKKYLDELESTQHCVQFKDASVSWSTQDENAVLSNVNLNIDNNKLTVITGNVGSGKTALLSSIVGSMHLLSGKIHRLQYNTTLTDQMESGGIAYCAQTPFILNASLKDNILFGGGWHPERYKTVIWACCLEEDVKQLPDGDLTQIGERGVNLSGGQKARVSLARAVYRRSVSLYIFDGVLSALDTHVSAKLMQRLFSGLLYNKCCIMSTHNTDLMEIAHCVVNVSDDGVITKKYNTEDRVVKYNTEIDDKVQVLKSSQASVVVERKHSLVLGKDDSGNDAEKRDFGSVRGSMYKKYFGAMGYCVVCFIVLSLVGEQSSMVAAGLWLAHWSTSQDNTALFYGMIYSIISCVGIVWSTSAAILWARGGIGAARVLHSSMLDRVLYSPIRFFDVTPAGRILNRFASDTTEMDANLPMALSKAWKLFSRIVFVIILQAVVLPFILLAYVPIIALYFTLMEFYRRTYREVNRLDNVTKSPIFSVLAEAVAGGDTIRAYGAVNRFEKTSTERVERNGHATYKKNSVNRFLGLRLDWMGVFISFFVVVLSVAGREELSAGLVGLVITFSFQITTQLNWLVRMTTEAEGYMNAVERIVDYATLPTEGSSDAESPPDSWPALGRVQYINVNMRYNADLPLVLKDVSLDVLSGMSVGVCGRTGSGKSSLLVGLFRLSELEKGSIMLDGLDLSKVSLKRLRSSIALVPQDPILFQGSLRRNIDQMGVHTDENIIAALKQVGMLDRVREKTSSVESDEVTVDRIKNKAKVQGAVPESVGGSQNVALDVQVSEGGSNWSAGERQLLCFARVLLSRKTTKVLCLDEATSSVDDDSDSNLQELLKTHFGGCTVITIAHRLNTISGYDKVLVMDNGRVVEFDNPSTLLTNPESFFYKLNNAAQD